MRWDAVAFVGGEGEGRWRDGPFRRWRVVVVVVVELREGKIGVMVMFGVEVLLARSAWDLSVFLQGYPSEAYCFPAIEVSVECLCRGRLVWLGNWATRTPWIWSHVSGNIKLMVPRLYK